MGTNERKKYNPNGAASRRVSAHRIACGEDTTHSVHRSKADAKARAIRCRRRSVSAVEAKGET